VKDVHLNGWKRDKNNQANSPKEERCGDMKTILENFRSCGSRVALFKSAAMAVAMLALGASARADRTPTVPSVIEVPEGNKVECHAYAIGVQIYVWNGSSWVFQAPEAVLYASAEGEGEVATHYAGPTWESNSGSKVVGMRLAGVTVDASAIPWLLLKAKTTEGPGIFERTTYVQRINTVGGIAPSTAGDSVGQVARVPYTAEYYFYRAQAR
jgi:hypothetical protein